MSGGIPPVIRKSNGDVYKVNATGFPLSHGFTTELGYIDVVCIPGCSC